MAKPRDFHRPRYQKRSDLDHCSLDRRKVRYRDKKLALNFLHNCQNLAVRQIEECGETRRHENRAYKCDACKGWHLTSQAEFTLAV